MDFSKKHKRKHQAGEAEPERKVKHKKHDSRKISNLIQALDEALEAEAMDETLSFIGEKALNRCLMLKDSLSQFRSKIEAPNVHMSTVTQPPSPDSQNVPKTLSPYSITPWSSSNIPTSRPPKPKVLDPTLEAMVFVHRGMGVGSPTDLNYERLEWVGDIYMELIATLLISQTFPSFNPGQASQLRERLVKNLTLAEFSRHYGFDRQAKLPQLVTSKGKPEDVTKIYGDIFEAYIAAVILSDPKDGLSKASQWLKDLWGMKIKNDIINEEKMGIKIDSPLWRLRGTDISIQDITSNSHHLNPKDELQKRISYSKVALLTYKDAAPEGKDPNSKLPLFTVGVYLNGWGEKDKLLAIGKANGKKSAGMKAASEALEKKDLIDTYSKKKRLYMEEVEREKKQEEKMSGHE